MTVYENYNVIEFKSCIQKFTVWRLRKKYSFGGPEVFLRFESDHDFSRPWFSKIKVQIKRPFGLQQTFCRRAGKSRQFALVAQRCNLALQPNLELIQRQTWFFVQSCRARVFTSLYSKTGLNHFWGCICIFDLSYVVFTFDILFSEAFLTFQLTLKLGIIYRGSIYT